MNANKLYSLTKNQQYFAVVLAVLLSLLVVWSITSGATTISANIDTGGTLTVSGASSLSGAINASSTLQVTGNAIFYNYVGIGTTSPYANLSIVSPNNQASTSPLFAIGSSTPLAGGAYLSVSGRGSANFAGRAIDPEFLSENRGNATNTDTTTGTTLDGAFGVFVVGKYAYVASNGRDSLAVIDISNPASTTVIAETQGPTPGTSLDSANGIFVSGKYAYVVNFVRDSLAVIDISNPANPTFIAETQGTTPGTTLNGALGVFVSGKYAYVANVNRDSLAVIDVSNPASPTFIAETQGTTPGTTLDGADSVFVSGKYAYVTNSARDSLAVIDISNPASPTFIAETQGPTPGTTLDGVRGIFVSGKYAYVVNNIRDSLAVIDVSNPANPTFIAETQGTTPGTTLDGARGIFVSGKYAYVANQTRDSLAVIDISGAEISNAFIGNLETSNLSVDNYAVFGNGVNIMDGLNVGLGGILSNGPLSVSATNSPSIFLGRLIIGTSSPASTSPNLFEQSVAIIEATSSQSVVLTLRGAGTQTGNLLQLQSSDNSNVFFVNSSGGFISSASSTFSSNLSISGFLNASSSISVGGNITATSTATTTLAFEADSNPEGGCIQLRGSNGIVYRLYIAPGDPGSYATSTNGRGSFLAVWEAGTCQ